MADAYICDALRTPFGKYSGALSSVRADDLAAIPIKALMDRNPKVDWGGLDDVIYGCANQAGEDNRNVARMALLPAGWRTCRVPLLSWAKLRRRFHARRKLKTRRLAGVL